MIKHFCDRCGKEVEWNELINNKLGIKPTLMLHCENCDEIISLCPDCQKYLMYWVKNAKATSGEIPPADELVELMQEKIETLQYIGSNMCYALREIAAGGPIDPNVWLRLGQLMNEWEDKS